MIWRAWHVDLDTVPREEREGPTGNCCETTTGTRRACGRPTFEFWELSNRARDLRLGADLDRRARWRVPDGFEARAAPLKGWRATSSLILTATPGPFAGEGYFLPILQVSVALADTFRSLSAVCEQRVCA